VGFWRHWAIALAAIAALAGTPLPGALCAGLCAPGQGHHAPPSHPRAAAAASCHETPEAPEATLGALDAAGCVSHGGPPVELAPARGTSRDDGWAGLVAVAASNAPTVMHGPRATQGIAAHGWRRILPPRPHAPIALRI
jgi:hypothetical protein